MVVGLYFNVDEILQIFCIAHSTYSYINLARNYLTLSLTENIMNICFLIIDGHSRGIKRNTLSS